MILGIVLVYSCMELVIAIVESDFIVDYFSHKKAPNVVGFSCNSIQDDLQLLKNLNRQGMTVSLKKLKDDTDIHNLATNNGVGIFIDIRCYKIGYVESILSQASNNRMFDELRCWLILSSDLDKVSNIIEDGNFGMSTDFVAAVQLGSKRYGLYDFHNIYKERGKKPRIILLGNWLKDRGLQIILKDKALRRSNMQGITLKASFYKPSHKPENMGYEEYFQDKTYGTLDGSSKYGFNILRHLSNIYNFTLRAVESSAWRPGDSVGPVGRDVSNGSADFTGTALVITYKRLDIVKFLHHAWPLRTCFIFRSPQPKNIKVQEILRPFANKVWYLMITILVISFPITIMMVRIEEFGAFLDGVSHSFLIVIGTLCQQSSTMSMKRLSTRLFFLSISIYSYVMYTYYSCSVVSARLDEPIFKINDSLNQMSKLRLKLGSEWFAAAEFFIKGDDKEHQTFFDNHWSKLPEDKKFLSPEAGIQLVKDGGFAYHTRPEASYPIVEKNLNNREVCELMEVHAMHRDAQSSFGTSVNNSVTEIWRIGLTKISEVGLRNHQILTWTYRKPKCDLSIPTSSSIDMDEFAPHLILLIVGMLASVILCIIEMVVVKCKSSGECKTIKILSEFILCRGKISHGV
ncbi:hypothetical protein QAD02_004627 [Eretmocerus hayati]|uniref:Uncharacterized protein n=1 Tax=Eretmocerus hayati TaxID=131215 RepID=A0ACC2NUX7_9HYME|nr:hypothetical protein QAD02_004627 [Eretmocerus hayati]